MSARTIALWQATCGVDPALNARRMGEVAAEAAGRGAAILFTPEMTNLIDRDRARASGRIVAEADDVVVRAAAEAAVRHELAIALGSVAVRRAGSERFANRSLFIDAAGAVRARYDKLHLFDVALGSGDDWGESRAYAPGDQAVVVNWDGARWGLSICYDLRFPALYQALSGAGATVLAVPAAFTRPTGQAHWATLLRARAIENAAFVVAAAQTGTHEDGRRTWGHSTVVSPWGEVLLDMGEGEGVGVVAIDPDESVAVRGRIDVLTHRRVIPPVVVS